MYYGPDMFIEPEALFEMFKHTIIASGVTKY